MKFAIKRYWEMTDTVEVEADSKEDAIEKALGMLTYSDAEFVNGSVNVDEEVDVQLILSPEERTRLEKQAIQQAKDDAEYERLKAKFEMEEKMLPPHLQQ